MADEYDKDVKDIQRGLVSMEQEILKRYGSDRRLGNNLFDGNHWDAAIVSYIKKIYGEHMEKLPIRNLYRQKVRHTAFMMSPGAPVLQFQIETLPSEERDEGMLQDIQFALEQEMLEIFERSEYVYEAERAIINYENTNVAWFALIPIETDRNLEIMHIPTERVIFDPGVSRLRHIKWVAWVDYISKEQARTVFDPAVVDSVKNFGDAFQALNDISRDRAGSDTLLTITHLYALKGSNVPLYAQGGTSYKTFEKDTHLIMLEDKVVKRDHVFPKDSAGKSILPLTHIILEADAKDALGTGLSKTAAEPQKQINNVQLSIVLTMAENWNKRYLCSNLSEEAIDALNDMAEKYIVNERTRGEVAEITGPIISGDVIAAMDDATSSFEVQTGRYGALEGERPPNVDTASGLMHLTKMAQTPIYARTRMFGIAIKRLGEIYIGWKRTWGDGILRDEEGKARKGEDGQVVDVLKMLNVKVELDSLLELSKSDTFNTLAALVNMGFPVMDIAAEFAPVSGPVRARIMSALKEQQRAMAQQMQAAQQAGMQGEGGPPMSPEMAMGEGVELAP